MIFCKNTIIIKVSEINQDKSNRDFSHRLVLDMGSKEENSEQLAVMCCAASGEKLDRLERWLSGSNTHVSRTLSSYELLYRASESEPALVIISSEFSDIPLDKVVHELVKVIPNSQIVLLVSQNRFEQYSFLSDTSNTISVIVEDPQGQFVGRILGIIRKQHEWLKKQTSLKPEVLKGVLDVLPEAVVLIDQKINIRYVNKKFIELIDVTLSHIEGTPLMDILCDSIRNDVEKLVTLSFERGFATEDTEKIELLVKNSVGDVLPCRGSYQVVKIKDEIYIIFTLRDESFQISNEADRAYQDRFEKLVMDLSTDILGGTVRKLPVIMLTGLKNLSKFLEYHSVQVLSISSYLSTFQQFLSWPQKKKNGEDFEPIWLKKTVFNEGYLKVSDTQDLPLDAMEEFDWMRSLKMVSFIAVPVNPDDKSAGILIASRKKKSQWEGIDVERLQNIAKIVNSMLNRMSELKSFSKTQKELVNVNKRLTNLAQKDGLTGLANRRLFDQTLSREIRRSARQRQSLSLILTDIDFFKSYNDELGHVAGDKCLKGIGTTIDAVFQRAGDLTARYGGEEFAIVLPGSDKETALKEAERLQLAVKELNVPHPVSDVKNRVTMSMGIATIENSLIDMSEFIQKADAALYQAKNSGRNQVVHFDDI